MKIARITTFLLIKISTHLIMNQTLYDYHSEPTHEEQETVNKPVNVFEISKTS